MINSPGTNIPQSQPTQSAGDFFGTLLKAAGECFTEVSNSNFKNIKAPLINFLKLAVPSVINFFTGFFKDKNSKKSSKNSNSDSGIAAKANAFKANALNTSSPVPSVISSAALKARNAPRYVTPNYDGSIIRRRPLGKTLHQAQAERAAKKGKPYLAANYNATPTKAPDPSTTIKAGDLFKMASKMFGF